MWSFAVIAIAAFWGLVLLGVRRQWHIARTVGAVLVAWSALYLWTIWALLTD